jgi:hypothetical protein
MWTISAKSFKCCSSMACISSLRNVSLLSLKLNVFGHIISKEGVATDTTKKTDATVN